MPPHYSAPSDLARLARRSAGRFDLPSLIVMSDPQRTPDVMALARRTPPGSLFIYRHFGASNRETTTRELVRICRDLRVRLLLSNDPGLSRAVGADGVHWSQSAVPKAASARVRGGREFFTAAAHTPGAIAAAKRAGIDAVLFSPVFASASPSAIWPVGPLRARLALMGAKLPVYCLGGMNADTIRRLAGSGAAGFAMIGAMKSEVQP